VPVGSSNRAEPYKKSSLLKEGHGWGAGRKRPPLTESSPGLGRTGRDPPWLWLESFFGADAAVAALAGGSALGVARIVRLGCCRWLRGRPRRPDPGQKRFQLTRHWLQLPKQEDDFWKKRIGASVSPDQTWLLAWLEQTGEVEGSPACLATGVSASATRKLLAGLVVNADVESFGEEGEQLRLAPHLDELLARGRAPASSVDLPGEGTEQVTGSVTAQVTAQAVQVGQVGQAVQVGQIVLAGQGIQHRAALIEAARG